MPDGQIDQTEYFDTTETDAELQDPGATIELSFDLGQADFDEEMAGYTGWGMGVSWNWFSGLGFSPKAGPARTKIAIWRAHSEVSVKVVQCVGSAIGKVPKLPSLVVNSNPADVLYSAQISLPSRELTASGDEIFTVFAQYVYLQQIAQDFNQPICYPNSIMRMGSVAFLNPSDFSDLLHGAPTPPGDFTGSAITF